MCRLCCKSILSILSRNIDSRSGANAQQRFKGARAPIRVQISISQRLLGDFCNTIRQKATSGQLVGAQYLVPIASNFRWRTIRAGLRHPLSSIGARRCSNLFLECSREVLRRGEPALQCDFAHGALACR
ncbi:MAG: hypothetical protein QOJ15_11279 [Bradyrhizobium sp.]|nr:hypothetical protein [Bradyrhizobium sp.]